MREGGYRPAQVGRGEGLEDGSGKSLCRRNGSLNAKADYNAEGGEREGKNQYSYAVI